MAGEILPRLRYAAEGIAEEGSSQAYNTFSTNGLDLPSDIEAYAFTGSLEYLFDHPLQPRLLAEYLWGSGDPDRVSPGNTVQGNQGYTRDRSFNYFGYAPVGFALSPRLSNLHVVKGGTSLLPLEDCAGCESLETGVNGYAFFKDRPGGGIPDNRATLDRSYVGAEHDVYVHWKIFSDLLAGVRYGVFHPGDVYRDEPARHFLETSLLYTF